MLFSALLILFFHLEVPIWRDSTISLFLRKTSYIGVDIFFFLSAYSLASRKITNYKKYFSSRFTHVYLKFAIFTIIAAVISHWEFARILKVLCGIELFLKGGGAFLWFLPAITIFYIVFPLVQKLFEKHMLLTSLIVLLIWFIAGLIITLTTNYQNMFIFWNRIPALILGIIAASYSNQLGEFFSNKKGLMRRILIAVLLLIIGIFLLYQFGFKHRLSVPLYDMFYITALPSILGLILLIDLIPEVKIIQWTGSATLEMYAIQMIWGFKWAAAIYHQVSNALLSNILTFTLIIVLSTIISIMYSFVLKKINYLRGICKSGFKKND